MVVSNIEERNSVKKADGKMGAAIAIECNCRNSIWIFSRRINLILYVDNKLQNGLKPVFPKRPWWLKSSKKFTASVFWDGKGILLIDYLQSGKTITGEYFCSLFDQLDAVIHENKPGLEKK